MIQLLLELKKVLAKNRWRKRIESFIVLRDMKKVDAYLLHITYTETSSDTLK
jgi:hypothetical protein